MRFKLFTGIINHIGRVSNIENNDQDAIFEIIAPLDVDNHLIGASIAHNGVCLTLIEKQKIDETESKWKVQASTHTLELTNLSDWKIGTQINIEPSLKFGDELGGHLVSGHVDGIGIVAEIEKIFESTKITLEAPNELMKFIAQKGSIAIEGISLTVNAVSENSFCVNIIEHTIKNTTIGSFFIGMKVNLEIDPIARYVARYLEVNN